MGILLYDAVSMAMAEASERDEIAETAMLEYRNEFREVDSPEIGNIILLLRPAPLDHHAMVVVSRTRCAHMHERKGMILLNTWSVINAIQRCSGRALNDVRFYAHNRHI